MSSYISLYGRAKSGSGPYFCLNCWSRSTVVYQTFASIVPYGKTVPLTTDGLISCIKIAEDELEEHRTRLAAEDKRLDFMKSAQLSIEDLNKAYDDYTFAVGELNDVITETTYAIAEMRAIADMIDYSRYSTDGLDYYLACEDNPNYPETETETE